MPEYGGEFWSPSVNRRTFLKNVAGALPLAALSGARLNKAVYEHLAALDQRSLSRETPDGVYWDYVAKQYMFEPGLIMMNNGTAGAMPRVVYNTLADFFRIQAENPYKCYSTFDAYREEARHRAALFINADHDEVTFLRNATEGLTIVAYGLQMKAGDEVLMSNWEHPAGIYPWRLRAKRDGIQIKEVILKAPPKDKEEILNAFDEAITPRTRVILISHATYQTGLVPPLKEICQLARDKNVLVCADGAHCVGMLDLDMHALGVDFYANSGYKWLGAPTGTGLFYVRKDVQERVWPNIVEAEWENMKSALKYSYIGRTSDPLYIAMGEAVRFQTHIRKDRIERKIKASAAYLKGEALKIPGIQLLTSVDPDLSGGLTVLSIEGVKSQQLVNYLLEKSNLVVTPVKLLNAIRVCTHIWINSQHIDCLLEGLRQLAPGK